MAKSEDAKKADKKKPQKTAKEKKLAKQEKKKNKQPGDSLSSGGEAPCTRLKLDSMNNIHWLLQHVT